MISPEDYRARLHQARLDAGLTQRELAERIGCADSTVSNVELGHRDLGAAKLIAWAHTCRVSLDWIAGEAQRPQPAADLVELDLEPAS